MILDFCDSLSDPADVQGEQKVMLSKEIETAIRNITQLPRESVTTKEGKKRATTRIDRAREELEKSGLDGLKDIAIRNAKLPDRIETKIFYDGRQDERVRRQRNAAFADAQRELRTRSLASIMEKRP